MKASIIIKQEEEKDREAVFALNHVAFGQEDEALLVDRLRESPEFVPELSLVAWLEGRLVGHILFTKIGIGSKSFSGVLALAPMAVLPEHQQQGIGSELVKAGLAGARELHYEAVVVLGHPEYYPRFGFRPASSWGILCPFEVPDEAYLALELKPGALGQKEGVVAYSSAFGI